MRISDWSSDVCSSDLLAVGSLGIDLPAAEIVFGAERGRPHALLEREPVGLRPREHVGAAPRGLDTIGIDRHRIGRRRPERSGTGLPLVALAIIVALVELRHDRFDIEFKAVGRLDLQRSGGAYAKADT